MFTISAPFLPGGGSAGTCDSGGQVSVVAEALSVGWRAGGYAQSEWAVRVGWVAQPVHGSAAPGAASIPEVGIVFASRAQTMRPGHQPENWDHALHRHPRSTWHGFSAGVAVHRRDDSPRRAAGSAASATATGRFRPHKTSAATGTPAKSAGSSYLLTEAASRQLFAVGLLPPSG